MRNWRVILKLQLKLTVTGSSRLFYLLTHLFLNGCNPWMVTRNCYAILFMILVSGGQRHIIGQLAYSDWAKTSWCLLYSSFTLCYGMMFDCVLFSFIFNTLRRTRDICRPSWVVWQVDRLWRRVNWLRNQVTTLWPFYWLRPSVITCPDRWSPNSSRKWWSLGYVKDRFSSCFFVDVVVVEALKPAIYLLFGNTVYWDVFYCST